MTRTQLSLLLSILWFLSVHPMNAAEHPFFKGVTVSCQTWGVEWQTPEMARALDELKALGANSVAIHPYARIENDGHVSVP